MGSVALAADDVPEYGHDEGVSYEGISHGTFGTELPRSEWAVAPNLIASQDEVTYPSALSPSAVAELSPLAGAMASSDEVAYPVAEQTPAPTEQKALASTGAASEVSEGAAVRTAADTSAMGIQSTSP